MQESEEYSINSDGFLWFAKNSKEEINSTSKIPLLARTATTVKTPKGTSVSAEIRSELSSREIIEYNTEMDRNYPKATRIYTATSRFNCHSYAWYSQNTSSNIYWINSPSAFWTDGSYVKSSVGTGCKVRYLSGLHSAIVCPYTSGQIYYQSKWGEAGVYRHIPSDGPPSYKYSSGVSYYK